MDRPIAEWLAALKSFVGDLLALFHRHAQRAHSRFHAAIDGVAFNALIGAITSFVISLQWVR